ncbi:hypothetical protein TrVFT333_001610 [Trichoderma virens FT-333]|nr:hypothetical protein TrVFT333_001610 [Trichoderma virens FT-333]
MHDDVPPSLWICLLPLYCLVLSFCPFLETKEPRYTSEPCLWRRAPLVCPAPAASRNPDRAKLAFGRPCGDSGDDRDGAVASGCQFLSADTPRDKGCRHGGWPSIGAAERARFAIPTPRASRCSPLSQHRLRHAAADARLGSPARTASPGIDRTLWLYELCRFLISQCNSLIVGFLFDTPPCSASTCPEMRASEWQFLCAVHEQPKSCCAIDYCCHTLDWAANVVSDQKIFPSRFVVVSDLHSKNVGVKSLVNVFRRLHRIFAHAWFQHRSVFWAVEGQTGLYVFFKTVCDLVRHHGQQSSPPQILKPTAAQPGGSELEDDGSHGSVNRTNTRRHIRSSPSTGSSVTTVMEAEEEDADGVSRRLRTMHLAGPDVLEEEPEVAEVPVIVEHSVISGPPPPLFLPVSNPGQDEAGTVSDLSDAGQTGVSESIVEITDDDVTSVIDTSDAHTTEQAEEATAAANGDSPDVKETPDATEESSTEAHVTEPSGEEAAAEHQESTTAETAPAEDVAEKEGGQGDEK